MRHRQRWRIRSHDRNQCPGDRQYDETSAHGPRETGQACEPCTTRAVPARTSSDQPETAKSPGRSGRRRKRSHAYAACVASWNGANSEPRSVNASTPGPATTLTIVLSPPEMRTALPGTGGLSAADSSSPSPNTALTSAAVASSAPKINLVDAVAA